MPPKFNFFNNVIKNSAICVAVTTVSALGSYVVEQGITALEDHLKKKPDDKAPPAHKK